MSRLIRGAVATVFAGALVAAPLAPARADDGVGPTSVTSSRASVLESGAPLFDLTRVAPGWSESRVVVLDNDSDEPATLALTAIDVVEAENGCNHAESVADTTCGADDGELGGEIAVAAYLDPDHDGVFESVPRWTGSLHDLTEPATLTEDVPARDTATVRLQAELPYTSGNETQTDQVSFALRFDLARSDSTVTTVVEGTRTRRDSPGSAGVLGDLVRRLPFTGAPAERLAYAGLWLLVLGAAVVAAAGARRQRRQDAGMGPGPIQP